MRLTTKSFSNSMRSFSITTTFPDGNCSTPPYSYEVSWNSLLRIKSVLSFHGSLASINLVR